MVNKIEATGDAGGDNNACIGEENRGACEVCLWKFASESESCDVEQEGSHTGDIGFGVVEGECGRTVSSSFRDP